MKKTMFFLIVFLLLSTSTVMHQKGEAGEMTGLIVETSTEAKDYVVKLLKDKDVAYFTTIEEAVEQLNNYNTDGYELQLLKDIQINDNLVLPNVSCTLSGAKEGGGQYRLRLKNGNFIPRGDITLKNIKLSCVGYGGGKFFAYSLFSFITINFQENVVLQNIELLGSTNYPSAVNILSDIDLTYKNIRNVQNVILKNGSTLSARSLEIKNLSLNSGCKVISDQVTVTNLNLKNATVQGKEISLINVNLDEGSILEVEETGGLTISGNLLSNGQKENTFILPTPTDHDEIVYSLQFSDNAVFNGLPIKIQPVEGLEFSIGSRLIYLGDNNKISKDKFTFTDPSMVWTIKTLDDKRYLTLIKATTLFLVSDMSSLTYGDTATLTAIVVDKQDVVVSGGNIRFYRGESPQEENFLAEVSVDSNGKADCPLAFNELNKVGEIQFCALYVAEDSLYANSTAAVTVEVVPKRLAIEDVIVGDKVYDGTTEATLISLILSGIISGDEVVATASASFTSPEVGEEKEVNLSAITLTGKDGAKYVVDSQVLAFPTGAKILQVTPRIILDSTVDWRDEKYTVKLTASIVGPANGANPTGSVSFYKGTDLLKTVQVLDGTATLFWEGVSEGVHDFTVRFSGDTTYTSAEEDLQVNVEGRHLSSSKEIISFSFPEATGPAIIGDGIIEIQVDSESQLTALIPTIEISKNAIISPLPGIARNFTNPVIYTVTAEDGSTKEWQVIVSKSPEIKMEVSPSVVTEGNNFTENFTFTILNDTVAEAVYASDIILTGDFADLNVKGVKRENATTVAAAVYGNLSAETGKGIISLAPSALRKSRNPLSASVKVYSNVILVEKVTLTAPSSILRTGETMEIGLAVSPSNAWDKTVTWSVIPETGVAAIDQRGLLTGISPGTVKVVATANDESEVQGSLVIFIENGEEEDKDSKKRKRGNKQLENKYDQYIKRALQKNTDALIPLENSDNFKIEITPRRIYELAVKNKSLVLKSSEIAVKLPTQVFLTNELRAAMEKTGSKVMLGIRKLSNGEKEQLVVKDEGGDKAKTIDIGCQIFELTAGIMENTRRVMEIKNFNEPIAVTIDLAFLNLPSEITNLTGIRYQKDKDGKLVPVKLGGSYDRVSQTITFFTRNLSLYSVAQGEKLTTISLMVDNPRSIVNGGEIHLDTPPLLIDSRTMVPLRFVAESMGAAINWLGKERKITIKLGTKNFQLRIDQPLQGIDSQVVIINNRTMVPLRFIAEKFDSHVQWFPRQKKIYIVR